MGKSSVTSIAPSWASSSVLAPSCANTSQQISPTKAVKTLGTEITLTAFCETVSFPKPCFWKSFAHPSAMPCITLLLSRIISLKPWNYDSTSYYFASACPKTTTVTCMNCPQEKIKNPLEKRDNQIKRYSLTPFFKTKMIPKIYKSRKTKRKGKGSLVGSITWRETSTDSLVSILQVYCTMVFWNTETIVINWQEII